MAMKIYNLRISMGVRVFVRLLGLQLVVPGLQRTEKIYKISFLLKVKKTTRYSLCFFNDTDGQGHNEL